MTLINILMLMRRQFRAWWQIDKILKFILIIVFRLNYRHFVRITSLSNTEELTAKLLILSKQARVAEIFITIDAEETERLEMSLLISFSFLFDWLASLAKYQRCKIPVRLVKGTYWDQEIKWV